MVPRGGLLVVFTILLVGPCSASLKGKFVQINDIHYDPTYLYGSGDSCNMELESGARQPYGHYDCDASWNLTESALYKVDMESSRSDTDFIIWAGDIVMHVREPDMLNAEKVLAIINTTARMVKARVMSGVPIYPMLGNHDFFPKDQLPEHNSDDKNDFYARLADILCPLFIGDEACVLFRQNGYYSKVLDGKLRVVIMNSNLYSVNNHAVKGSDPAGQFAWLRNELQQAQADNQKVHVFAHIPPGMLETSENVFMFKSDYNENFNKIIRDFAKVIIGVYSAHTHTDSFRIFYSEADHMSVRQPMVPLLINPSVTPQRFTMFTPPGIAHNPALRSIYYDVTGPDIILRDYTQFYLPLDKANSAEGHMATWEEEYRFTRSYPVPDLTAESLHKVVTDFRKEGSNSFHKYFDLNSVRIHENEDRPTGRYYCNCACKVHHICTIENVDREEYLACIRDDVTCASGNIHSFIFLMLVMLVLALQNVLL